MTPEKAARAARLRSTIDQMLAVNETISTRNIMKRMPADFTYPNAITRPQELRSIYEEGRQQQKRIRSAASLSHDSRSALESKITKQALKIEELQGQIEVLVASHRAMYAAVGELGGAQAWLRFFDKHQAALRTLDDLQARPSSVRQLRPVPLRASNRSEAQSDAPAEEA